LAANVQRRKDLVYGVIDGSEFYNMDVNKQHRSAMSISMTIVVKGIRRKDLEKEFVLESTSLGLIQLFGHPVRGGLRVTLYHGVTDEAVDALIKFMSYFRSKYVLK
jgi:phosphoserine aminotransferase